MNKLDRMNIWSHVRAVAIGLLGIASTAGIAMLLWTKLDNPEARVVGAVLFALVVLSLLVAFIEFTSLFRSQRALIASRSDSCFAIPG